MAGSLRQRPDRGPDAWELRIYLGRDQGGRVRHRSVLLRVTKRAAQRELTRLAAEQDRVPAVVPTDLARPWGPATTINDAIEGWRANGWDDLSPSTVRRYQSMVKVHIQDSIGRRRIVSLGPYDVERYFRDLKTAGLSQASVRQIRAVLHRSCRLARKWSSNVLPNPITDTELPEWSLAESGPAVRSPTPDEVRRLLAASQDDDDPRVGPFVRLVAATGMRRGEACALRWHNIDWERSALRVDEALVADAGGVRVRGPKTRASVRAIAVDTDTLAMLHRLYNHQRNLAAAAEVDMDSDAFAFSYEPGGTAPPYPDTLSHAFSSLRSRAGVATDVHLHSLRHFQSTELDQVISEAQKQARLGWATVHMARHYTGVVPSEDRRAAEHMGTLLEEREGQQ